MPFALKAIYRNGTLILQTPCNLPEGAEVDLFIQSPQIAVPPITDLATKQRFLTELIDRMQRNMIPANAPKLTREMLHERR
ncbi:antitoxin family protein [Microseira sp. BLCC-F43]|uniref:antitoxin family protein n=1 Tax=Microseira sp. BLCC-F43 TaxID=3153602 RepID=UPI0035B963B6